MKNSCTLKQLTAVIFCCYHLNVVLAGSHSIEKFRKEITKEGESAEGIFRFMKDRGKRYGANFEKKEHIFVSDWYTGQKYDSSTGAGAVEKQYGGSCPVNTYDNTFYLEAMGDVYYSEFSRKLRPTKDFYLFYTFIVMYDTIKKEQENFKNFDKFIEDKWQFSARPLWLSSLPVGLLSEIARDAGVSMDSEDNADFKKMAELVFTNIKNREGLDGNFTFEEDAPHLMNFFGYSEEDSKRAIEKHLKNYFSYNTNYMNASVNGYNSDVMDIERVLITRESLIFLEYFSAFYNIYEQNNYKRIRYISVDEKEEGLGFQGLLANGEFQDNFTSKRVSSSPMVIHLLYEKINQNYGKIGALLSFYRSYVFFIPGIRNLLMFPFDIMNINSLTIGGYYKNTLYDWNIHLNSGIMLDFTWPGENHNLEDKFDFNFKNRNVTLFVRGQRIFNSRVSFLPTMIVAADLAGTWFDFYDIQARKKFTNYSIGNNGYYLISVNLDADFTKKITQYSSVSMYFRGVHYLNKPANGFVLQNKTYKDLTLETESVIDVKNSFSMGFAFFYGEGGRFSYRFGYNVNLRNTEECSYSVDFMYQL